MGQSNSVNDGVVLGQGGASSGKLETATLAPSGNSCILNSLGSLSHVILGLRRFPRGEIAVNAIDSSCDVTTLTPELSVSSIEPSSRTVYNAGAQTSDLFYDMAAAPQINVHASLPRTVAPGGDIRRRS